MLYNIRHLRDPRLGKELDLTPKAQKERKIDKLDFIKTEKICLVKDHGKEDETTRYMLQENIGKSLI